MTPAPPARPLDHTSPAESTIGLYKTEPVRHDSPWRGAEDLELATLSWVHWFNTARLHSGLGHRPPIEYEDDYSRQHTARKRLLLAEPSLH